MSPAVTSKCSVYIHLILFCDLFIPGYSSPVSLLQCYQIPICVKYSVESSNRGKRMQMLLFAFAIGHTFVITVLRIQPEERQLSSLFLGGH